MTGTIFKRQRMKETAAEIITAGLFDRSFYVKRYPDIEASGVDPVTHYIEHGAYENRRANAVFDLRWYRARSSFRTFTAALHHYMTTGDRRA